MCGKLDIMGAVLLTADIKTNTPIARDIIRASFITSYERALWVGVLFSLLGALTAAVFITEKRKSVPN